MDHDFSPQQIDALETAYAKSGVVRVRGLFSPQDIADIRNALDSYQRAILPGIPESDRTYESDGQTIRNLWRIEKHDPWFLELARRSEIHTIVSRLVNGNPILMGIETFNKPALVGSGVPWHQDNMYFCQAPPDVLTIWIAIDPATVENGAVYYAPGTQNEVQPHEPSGVAGNSMKAVTGPADPVEDQFCGTLNPGDALIHHCQTMHRSDPNRSPHSRLGLLMVFRGEHTQYDPDLKTKYDLAQSR